MIQTIIGLFFYNEYRSRKNAAFLNQQLEGITVLKHLTADSRIKLDSAQHLMFEYQTHNNQSTLDSFFRIINSLTENLSAAEDITAKNPNFKLDIRNTQNALPEISTLQKFVDSTQKISRQNRYHNSTAVPKLRPFNLEYNFEKFNLKTETFSDSVEKKGLVGRLKDAFTGKVNVQKDSTVVTVHNARVWDASAMKTEIDNIVTEANHYYLKEIERMQTIKNNGGEQLYPNMFNQLMIHSNSLLKQYQTAVSSYQSGLEEELAQVASKSNTYRMYLVVGLMSLMFVVSILIMYFTRMAFVYENKLTSANLQIKEHLNFRNRILGMLSHELRSPLKIIGIFINRIRNKTDDPTIKEYLQSISFTNNTLLMQADQILAYTKNHQVKNKLNPAVFNLKEEITSILAAVEPYIQTRNNDFQVEMNISPDINVWTDGAKINQLFMNILGNANKFTENGKITVAVSAQPENNHIIAFQARITDTGVGISEEDLAKIFQPYYQGVLTAEIENLGAGLGLSLCKELVELYSGSLHVTSALGQGTAVKFSLQLHRLL